MAETSTLEDLADRLAAAASEVRELADEARELLDDELERAGAIRLAKERQGRSNSVPADEVARGVGLSDELTQLRADAAN